MVKKLKTLASKADGKADMNQLAKTIRDSAQQIWLAGLGAFSKAQNEGGKVFDTLVKEGLNIQRRTRAVTEERIGAVGEKMTRAAGDLSKQATQSWDRLEQVFEDRVSRALTRLGVPSSREIGELVARVDELNETVQSMMGVAPKRPARKASAATAPRSRAPGAAKKTAGAARKSTAAKTNGAARKAATRKTSAAKKAAGAAKSAAPRGGAPSAAAAGKSEA